MHEYTILLLYLLFAELCRRCVKVLLKAFTGPMSRVPGPLLMKLSNWPWTIIVLTGNPINVSPKLFEKYGRVVRIGPNEIMISGRDAIQKVLVELDLKKSPFYELMRENRHITNLLTERDNVLYKQKRRLLSTGFSISYLNGLEPLMQGCIQVFVEVLQKKCSEGNGSAVVDIAAILSNLTFDILSATSFGGSYELVRTGDGSFKKIFRERLMRNSLHVYLPFLRYIPFAPPRNSAEFDAITRKIVSKRRAEMEKGDQKQDLLQIFLDTHDSNPLVFTEKHIFEEMRLFMIAGSDTSAATATFVILLLLRNPSKLALLLEEIDVAFHNIDGDITFAATQNLQYLNACISEGMRLIPIVRSGVPRITEKTIFLDGFVIPENVIVHSYLDAPMRDPNIWPDADQYIPERWIHAYQGKEVDRKAFIPFSAGMRNCIAQQFAWKEMRLILATFLRNFELSVVEGQNYEMRVYTVPYLKQGKYLVNLKSRV